jgi:glycosyltransferase involved in cell wall biosynthesis
MFIIPCKYNQLCLIEDTVKSIRQLYPHTKILVVDSDSEDKTYHNKLAAYDIIFADISNHHYESGALWYAVNKYKEDWYVLLQDSVILNKTLDEQIKSEELFHCFINFYEDSMGNHMRVNSKEFITRINEMLGDFDKLSTEENTRFCGVFGPNFIIKRKMIDMVLSKRLNETLLPTNKYDHQLTERVYGIVAKQCGVNILDNVLVGNLHQLMNGQNFNAGTETLYTDYINKTWLNKHRA